MIFRGTGKGAFKKKLGRSISDRDFLPATLEILVTPPSPISSILAAVICAAFVVALTWSWFGWIDIHAVAIGKIQPSGRSKIVQPLEPGRVLAVHVENGAIVREGDLLLELDSTETGAERLALSQDLEALNAEIERRMAALSFSASPISADSLAVLSVQKASQTQRRENDVLAAEIGQLRSLMASLTAQHAEKKAVSSRLARSIEARKQLLELTLERVNMRKEMSMRGAGSRALEIEALLQYESYFAADESERGQQLEAEASIVSIERKIEEARTQFVLEQTQKLAEVERKRDRLIQELVKAWAKNDRNQIRSPISGTIQQLTVTTIGQVVSAGQSLMTIVPTDGFIEVETLVNNLDIGFVEVGQDAIVKIDEFPFGRFGAIDARVSKISRDAVDDRASAGIGDAVTATRPSIPNNSQLSQASNMVFPAILTLRQESIRIGDKDVPLKPGMTVIVEIKTGRRRALDYFLSPLRELQSRSMYER